MRPGIRSTPILSSPTQASTFLFATMRFPAYCLTLFLATAHHQAVGRALAGCQGVFNCATGISTENTPVDGDTWTQTGKDIEHAARVNADTLSDDLARLEQQARDQFASWSRTAARSDPAKDLAAAIEAVGVTQENWEKAQKAVQAVQDIYDKSGKLFDQLEACKSSGSVTTCVEPIVNSMKALYAPLSDALVENMCDYSSHLEDYIGGPPRWEPAEGPAIWDSKLASGLFLAVFPGGQGAAVDLMMGELRKQGKGVERAFAKLQKSVRVLHKGRG